MIGAVDYSSSYLTRGLIAYIGNKRSLLPFLGAAFSRCAASLDTGEPPVFLDPFSGSGGVSRLARAMGFSVHSNDREYYAAVIARSRAAMDPARLEAAFASWGGSRAAFSAFDAFARGADPDAAIASLGSADSAMRRRAREAFSAAATSAPYIARHYAPRDTESADWRSERLFYTAENARFLDRAREAVELLFPADPLDPATAQAAADAKAALLDALLYEAATRVNTSGVFKACHRGFGGHGKDALGRIVSPMRLEPPDYLFGPPGSVGAEDAAAFCAGIASRGGADIAYLDPPYNQHQYGSNYHLLTTIARWDKPPVPESLDGSGFLLDRSGIRPDWVSTRSDFCRRGRASAAFASLLDSIDARFLLVSYSDGGIVPLEELREMLGARGSLRVEAVPYVAYRGGKQSATRTERTSELLFVAETSVSGSRASGRSATVGDDSAETLRRIRALGALEAMKRDRFKPRGRAGVAGFRGAEIQGDGRLRLDEKEIENAPTETLEALAAALAERACSSKVEAFDLVCGLLRGAIEGDRNLEGHEAERLARDAIAHLRKIAFRKYASEYGSRSGLLRGLLARMESKRLAAALDELDDRASRRMA